MEIVAKPLIVWQLIETDYNFKKKDEWVYEETYSALDGSEGKQVLGSVAAVSTPSLIARVVSLLQDKLLSLELWVLIAHPTIGQEQG